MPNGGCVCGGASRMGAYAPCPCLTAELAAQVDKIVKVRVRTHNTQMHTHTCWVFGGGADRGNMD